MAIKNLAKTLSFFIRSDAFFWTTLGILILGSLWIATASKYPMAFDEEMHFGLIQMYSGHLLPYGIPLNDAFAGLGLGPAEVSYLFHYLLALPYRLFELAGFSDMTSIILLRIFNIAMVVGSIIFYRKALLEANVPKTVAHGSLAAFTLIPIVPFMAGQLNYDNLLLLAFAILMWLIVKITTIVYATKKIPVALALSFIGTMLLTLSVKYAFLPAALAIGMWCLYLIVFVVRRSGLKRFWQQTLRQFNSFSKGVKLALFALLLIGVFFSARYVVNAVEYGNPIPDCAVVYNESACEAFGPWARNHKFREQKSPDFVPMSFPVYLTTRWIPDMIWRMTFTLAGKTNGFQTKTPLPILRPIGILFISIGCIALLVNIRKFTREYWYIGLVVLVSGVYIGTLAIKLYGSYVSTGVVVAVNGRYLLLVVPLLFAVFAHALYMVAKKYQKSNQLVIVLSLLLLIVFLQGGGALTYIVQGQEHWFLPGWGQASHDVLQAIFSPLTLKP